MCGRFTIHSPMNLLLQQFAIEVADQEVSLFGPRYNIAPTQSVPVIVAKDGKRHMKLMRWGLVPSWAKDLSFGNRTLNARAETLREKPSFRAAYKRRRCLVPADGYYEWMKQGNEKQPFLIRTKDERPFAMAGLWETWENKQTLGEIVNSFTVITTQANEATSDIHDRMPVILPVDEFEVWLDSCVDNVDELDSLLLPYPAEQIKAQPVSRYVGNVRNEGEECIRVERTLF